jgi:hypothetical protein
MGQIQVRGRADLFALRPLGLDDDGDHRPQPPHRWRANRPNVSRLHADLPELRPDALLQRAGGRGCPSGSERASTRSGSVVMVKRDHGCDSCDVRLLLRFRWHREPQCLARNGLMIDQPEPEGAGFQHAEAASCTGGQIDLQTSTDEVLQCCCGCPTVSHLDVDQVTVGSHRQRELGLCVLHRIRRQLADEKQCRARSESCLGEDRRSEHSGVADAGGLTRKSLRPWCGHAPACPLAALPNHFAQADAAAESRIAAPQRLLSGGTMPHDVRLVCAAVRCFAAGVSHRGRPLGWNRRRRDLSGICGRGCGGVPERVVRRAGPDAS